MASNDAFMAMQPAAPAANIENPNFLTQMDFSSLEVLDPSIEDGHQVIYDREVPFELRMKNCKEGARDVGTFEPIRCKILFLGDEALPENIRFEVTSENDLFYHYTHSVEEDSFKEMQQGQKLMIQFPEYIKILVKMLNSCIKDPQCFLAVFVMEQSGEAQLDFIQNMEYKFVELLSCDFVQSSEETVRQHITYRYNCQKSKTALMQARLQDVSSLIKVKNPSLLLQLQKTAHQQALAIHSNKNARLNPVKFRN